MVGYELRSRRMAAGISGAVLCQIIRKSRSWLVGVERGYFGPSEEEIRQIDGAINGIIATREQLTKFAAKAGLPIRGVLL